MPRLHKILSRTLTTGSTSSDRGHEGESFNNTVSEAEVSVMEGGSCPASPQVKKACRLVVLGSTQTGKTCIINRFLKNSFDDSYKPTIENFHRKLFRIHGEFYQLDILEVGGNDPFPAARRLSLITGDLFLLVFGVDNRTSYEEVLRIRDQIIEVKDETVQNVTQEEATPSPPHHHLHHHHSFHHHRKLSSKQKRIPIVIAANKTDVASTKHEVDLEEVRLELMGWDNCAFAECSAKTNANIDELFFKLFHLAKLPKQMSPGMHRHAGLEKSVDSSMLLRKQSPVIRLRSKHSEPAMAFDADVKRPSLRTDLLMLQVKKSQQPFVTPLERLTLNNSPRSRRQKRCSIM